MTRGGPTRRLVEFWQRDLSLTVMLGLLVVLLFILVPLSDKGPFGVLGVMTRLTLTLLLAAGMEATGVNRGWLLLALLAGMGPYLLNYLGSSDTLVVADYGLTAILMIGLASLVLRTTFRSGPITAARIQGAIAAFLLLGTAWGMVYGALHALDPGAFSVPPSEAGSLPATLLYFSFTTLTTLGYGDVTPVSPVARALANAEALTGLLYPAILISRLVTMELAHRHPGQPSGRE